MGRGGGEGEEEGGISKYSYPTKGRALSKLPTEQRCRNFVNKHRLSVQIGAKRTKNVYICQCAHFPTELPFCIPPLLVG